MIDFLCRDTVRLLPQRLCTATLTLRSIIQFQSDRLNRLVYSSITIHSDVRAYRPYYYILNAGRLNTKHTATESQKHEDNELSLELARATIS